MDIEKIAHFATAASAIVAAVSVLSGFFLYKLSRRDQRLKEMRESMVAASSTSHNLDNLLSFEIAYEVVTHIANSIILQPFLKKLHEDFFISDRTKLEDLEKFLSENTPVIYGSVSSGKTSDFEDGLKKIEVEASKIDFEFPGVARSLYAARNILRNSYSIQKRLAYSEDAWESAIKQCYQDENAYLSEFDFFISELTQLFVGTILDSLKRTGQDTINDTLASMDIVVRSHLGKQPNKLLASSKFQSSIQLIPLDKTTSVSEDLRQAERALEKVLSSEDLLSLRQLSTQVDTRESA